MRRRALVTGAGSGFGLSTALYLAAIGFDVIGLVPPGGEAVALSAAARERQLQVDVVELDLADASARRDVATGMDLWALVNNAGYMNAGQIRDVPLDEARRQFEVMVVAPADLARQAAGAMVERGHGRIVNVTSSAVHAVTPLTGWYTAAKAALRQINDSLRLELWPCGVDVVDIEPGGYRTGIWQRAASELASRRARSSRPDMYDRVLRHLAGGYALMGDPGDVALAVAFALTTGRPRRHIRVGPGAAWLRSADRLLPDAMWDRALEMVSGLG